MSKFTGQMSGPQDPAPVHVQEPRGSVGQDLVAGLGLGLKAYSMYQNKQAAISQEQAQANLSRATGAVLQGIESDLAAEVSGTKLEFNTLKGIRSAAARFGVDPLALRASVAKFRGKSTNEMLYSATTQEQKDLLAKQEERRTAEQNLADLAGFLPASEYSTDISSLSDEELHQKMLRATVAKSNITATQARAEMERAVATNAKAKRAIDVRQFTDDWLQLQGNQIGGAFLERVKYTGFEDPEGRKALIQEITEDKAQLPAVIRENARQAGLSLSTEEVQNASNEMASRLDNLVRVLKREDVSTLTMEQMEEAVDLSMSDLLQNGTKPEKWAIKSLVISKKLGVPPSLTNFKELVRTSVKASITDGADVALRFMRDLNKLNPDEIQVAKDYLNQNIEFRYSPDGTPDQDVVDGTMNTLINDFSGSKSKKKTLAESGVFDAHIRGIADGTLLENATTEQLLEAQEVVAPEINKVIASRISSFMRTRQDTQIGFGGSLGANEKPSAAFDIDMNTLMIKPTGVFARQPRQAQKLNNTIQFGLRALQKLQAPEEQIQQYKNEVLMAFGMVGTNLE